MLTKRFLSYLIFLSLLSALSVANAKEKLNAAGCLIKADNRIVMVTDSINKKLALPAGMIEPGESPSQAALRETLEESGIKANIVNHHANWGRFALYHCQAIGSIKANPKQDKPTIRLYGYGASHIGTEIQSAVLVDLTKIQASDLRFPNQLEQLKHAYRTSTQASKVDFLQDNLASASAFHKLELKIIQQFQEIMGSVTKPLFLVLNTFGEEWLYYYLLPIIFITLGWQMGARLLLILLIGQIINHMLKISFGLPRPFDFMPSLQSMPIWGYGLPSGHTQNAALFWGFLYWYDWRVRFPSHKIVMLLIASSLIIGTGLARIYFGVHFISDIVTGATIGALILALTHQCDKRGWSQTLIEAKFLPWLGLISIAALCVYTTHSTWLLQVLFGIFALWSGLKQGSAAAYEKNFQHTWLRKTTFVTVTVLGIYAIVYAYALARSEVIHNSHIATLLALRSFAIIYWLSAGSYIFLNLVSLGGLIKNNADHKAVKRT